MPTPSIESLINTIHDFSQSSDTRRAALYSLGQTGNENAIDVLIASLADSEESISSLAGNILREKFFEASLDRLLLSLKHENPQARKHAALTLAIHGNLRAVEPLAVVAEHDEDMWVAGFATMALGIIGDNRVVDLLLRMLQDSSRYSNLTMFVCDALGNLGDPRAIPILVKLNEDEYDRFITRALAAIGTPDIIKPLIQALGSSDMKAGWAAKDGLLAIGKLAVEDLIVALRNKSDDNEVRAMIVEMLGEIKDERAVDAIIEALDDEDDLVVGSAIVALGELGDKRAIDPLRRFLNHPDTWTRTTSRSVLRELGYQLDDLR